MFIKSIFNYIREKKIEEFRREKNIYYVPEDFHTNPKYKVFDNFHSVEPKPRKSLLSNITVDILDFALDYIQSDNLKSSIAHSISKMINKV